MFIEIPLVVADPQESDVDYEGLGIQEPEAPKVTITGLVNLNNIGRINPVDDEELYKTVLFCFDEDQPVFRTPLEYDQILRLIKDATVRVPSFQDLHEQLIAED